MKTIYKVYADGECIKESETFFTSLAKAKEFMKTKFEFCKKWDGSILTLCKCTYENDNDLEMGNYDSEQINTKTTIINF